MLPILIAAQIAGAAYSIYSANQAATLTGKTAALEQQQLELNMQQRKLAATFEGIESTKRLRQTIASQTALFAARGQAGGVGSALSLQNESIGEYNADEYARNLNVQFGNNDLIAKQGLLGINAKSQKQAIYSKTAGGLFESISFNKLNEGLENGNFSQGIFK